MMYKCQVKIIPYVMNWDGIVTTYHKNHIKAIDLPIKIETYILTRILKKTLESISFEKRRGFGEEGAEEEIEEVIKRLETIDAKGE